VSAPSPLAADTSLVTFAVKVDGQPIDSAYQVDSIDTWTAVNRVPKARLVIFDGSPAAGDFPIADRPTFVPGRKVEIAVGYREKQTTIFRGLVVRQGIAIDRQQGSRLVVDATDEALRMTLQRRNGLFLKVKDSELIGKLIKDNGLTADVAATNTLHAEVVQYYATDWDLVLTRAEMNGLVAIADAGKVSVKAPDTSASPVLTLTYGESILDLEAQLDAATQYASSAVKSASWDFAAQKVAQAGPGSVRVKEPGNLSSDELAGVFKVKAYLQQTGGSLEPTALTDWSSAFLLKSKLSKLRGSVRFQGSALAKAGTVVLLAGCGARFDGPVFVSGVHHEVRDGVWLTTAELGLSPRWFTAEADGLAAPEASGQLPPIRGLQTGVVKQLDQDPDGEFRVQVALPILQDDAKRLWRRGGPRVHERGPALRRDPGQPPRQETAARVPAGREEQEKGDRHARQAGAVVRRRGQGHRDPHAGEAQHPPRRQVGPGDGGGREQELRHAREERRHHRERVEPDAEGQGQRRDRRRRQPLAGRQGQRDARGPAGGAQGQDEVLGRRHRRRRGDGVRDAHAEGRPREDQLSERKEPWCRQPPA
jgi:phage protein D